MGSPAPADPLSATRRRSRAGLEARARSEAGPGLYVHVPFCAARCHYCDFSSGALSTRAVEDYLSALESEAAVRAPAAHGVEFRSMFFGGGTPSALSPSQFTRLRSGLAAHYRLARDAEITVEVNPESMTGGRLAAWLEAGVNRLSIGVQSFDDEELRRLGRIHGAAHARNAVNRARAGGVTNLSLDLMFGFPGHSRSRWLATLEEALALAPDHLSAYCYIPEPGTPMGDGVRGGTAVLPSADEQAVMYDDLRRLTAAAGLVHYEVSNFARPGMASRHNLAYWLRRDYLGLGPSAHSLWRGVRWGNVYSGTEYARRLLAGGDPVAERERATARSVAEEAVFLGLRLTGGLCLRDYDEPSRAAVIARFSATMTQAAAHGFLEAYAEGWRVPIERFFLLDDVLARLLLAAERRAGSDVSVVAERLPASAVREVALTAASKAD
jgi:oxygen-independent coproporphyrinogen-3 oxidase